MTLYDEIGKEFVEKAITEFYIRAFEDRMIGHFFFEKNREYITRMQIDFATSALGGPRNYVGKSLVEAHRTLNMRLPHFKRRQVLMAEVLDELGLRDDLKQKWLDLEESLRPLILGTAKCC